MSTPTPTPTYPLYVKPSPFWGYNAYYLDSDSIRYSMSNREPLIRPENHISVRQIGSITYYTTPPTSPTLPPTTQNIYTLTHTYLEETTDPHIYIFYTTYKFLAVITLDDPCKLIKDDILRPDYYVHVTPLIPSTSAVIFKNSAPYKEQERCRITIFDTNDRINYRGADNITPLGYNAILRKDLLPPDQIVWNNNSFCKFSESNSDRATYLIDEQDLKISSCVFLVNKKTNDVQTTIAKDKDFMDIVAMYLDDDTANTLAVIKPSDNLAYTDTLLLKSETFYTYKGEVING